MKIAKIKARLLNVNDQSFSDKSGKNIDYYKATLIIEGDIYSVGVDKAIVTSLKEVKDKEGEATFELSSDFKQRPKLKLVEFK